MAVKRANHLNGVESTKGKSFATQKQNINKKGAPRKTISSVNIELEAQGITEATPNDIKSCYLRLINIDLVELKKKVEDITQPAMIRIVGKSILSGKGFDVIEKMLDRSIGRAHQTTDITTNGKDIVYTPLWGELDSVFENDKANDSE
jgi:hypothetical protein